MIIKFQWILILAPNEYLFFTKEPEFLNVYLQTQGNTYRQQKYLNEVQI